MPHINEKLDFCSEVFVVYDNKVLLRKHDKLDIWLSVGGHIEPNEDPCEAAIREVKEEVGLGIKLYENSKLSHLNTNQWKSLPNPTHVCRHNITEIHEHVVFIYYAESKTNKIIIPKTEKETECKWFSLEDLNKDTEIKDEIKHMAKEALIIFS
jgi:8-oxo-dGTP pyrophosphatase MutT (NUDIX family)